MAAPALQPMESTEDDARRFELRWHESRYDSLQRGIDDIGKKFDKVMEDFELRHREAEKDRRALSENLGATQVKLAQAEAAIETERAERATDITRIEAALDRVQESFNEFKQRQAEQQRDLWQEILLRALPLLVAGTGAGGALYGLMQLFGS